MLDTVPSNLTQVQDDPRENLAGAWIVIRQRRTAPVWVWLRRFGSQFDRMNRVDGSVFILLRRVSADAHGSDGFTAVVFDQYAAGHGDQTAI